MALFYDSGELGPAYATVAMATAVASVLGGPIAACLLMLNGLGGLHGWQVCSPYTLESSPLIVIRLVCQTQRLSLPACRSALLQV